MAKQKMWVIDETKFPDNKDIEEKLNFLLRYGILAPNPQNSQPWKFEIKKNKITILPDTSKRIKTIDNDSREIWISMGCVVENLIIAGENFGLFGKEKVNTKKIEILFKEKKPIKNKLFNYITKRVTNKKKAKRSLFKAEDIKKLKEIPFAENTNAYLLEDKKDLAQVIKLINEANDILYSNEKYKHEIISWMRFNEYQSKKTMDGISYKTMGVPPISSKIGRIFMSFFLSPKFIKKSDEQKIKNSSGIIIITSKRNCDKCWINTGRTLQRILLLTTSFGMQYSFLNKPCQIKKTRTKLKKITKDWPQIIIRLGHARTAPHTKRKLIEDFKIKKK